MKFALVVLSFAAALALAATAAVACDTCASGQSAPYYYSAPAMPGAGPMLPSNPDRTVAPVIPYAYPNVSSAGCPCAVPTCPSCVVQTCPCPVAPPPAPTCNICGF